MDISKFFRTMPVNFDRSQLLRQLDDTESDILKIDIPNISVANDLFGSKKLKSVVLKDYHAPLRYLIKSGDTLLPVLNTNAKMMPTTIKALRETIKTMFAEKISANGLSYRQLNLINFVEALQFYSASTRTYLRFLYDEESIAISATANRHLAKGEVNRLMSERVAFGRVIEFFQTYGKNIAGVLDKTVDAIFDESTHQIIQTNYTNKGVDPCNLFVVGVRYNIFWHISKFLTELQISQYKTNLDEKKALELRVLRLKELQAGQPTNDTEKELDFVEDKLKRVKAEIAELEVKYGT